jgi:hypothetical protein
LPRSKASPISCQAHLVMVPTASSTPSTTFILALWHQLLQRLPPSTGAEPLPASVPGRNSGRYHRSVPGRVRW